MLLRQTTDLLLKIESHLPGWLHMSFWISMVVLVISGYCYAIGSIASLITEHSNKFIGGLGIVAAIVLTVMILFGGES